MGPSSFPLHPNVVLIAVDPIPSSSNIGGQFTGDACTRFSDYVVWSEPVHPSLHLTCFWTMTTAAPWRRKKRLTIIQRPQAPFNLVEPHVSTSLLPARRTNTSPNPLKIRRPYNRRRHPLGMSSTTMPELQTVSPLPGNYSPAETGTRWRALTRY